ncbi:hypothetical protein P170DRAFT_510385 [Aspergillus steynii IBT 23096]|uniref:F-box domain-containing protein n=1 Tax=Aspergillus steynii IBT 23096 TaxID=1392250 RepID=A0A2I2G3V6_9EURO|nr:uncharacterized protein P170DRAFT_510385 [Aspergillus steynii IBT 23096]PLB47557.1 hypothetical protein P170DRAFT_510385 [Aspergillus steynii IBT 23096]
MAKKKPSFYCCICGGPFTPWGLRKISTVAPSEKENDALLFKDWCDCGADNYHGGAHNTSCAVFKGYDGSLLSRMSAVWLVNARMICARAGSEGLCLCNDDPSLCFITDVGIFSPEGGFDCGGLVGTLWPMQDGFITHELCWDMLELVHRSKFPSRGNINLPELWISLRIRMPPSGGVAVNWGDHCSYGGAGQFHQADWEPRPGYEWLVACPDESVDFAKIIDASVADPSARISRQSTLSREYRDPFFHLPAEIIHKILATIPYKSMVSLMLVSYSVREAGGSIWRTRLATDIPWHQGTQLFQSLAERKSFIKYGTLLKLLEKVSSDSGNIDGVESDQQWLGLRNRRRIWACCERIVEDIETRFAAARNARGFVSEGVEALSTFRIATVIEPKENEERCGADVYFVPTLTNTPSLQAITVYFLPEGSVVGIEFSLQGEEFGRILGHRSTFFQSVAVPSSLVINGFLLSLGPELPVIRDRPIRGLGVLTEDSLLQSRLRFGKWTGSDVVQVFRPWCPLLNTEFINQQVVGITGQWNVEKIFTFGIIVAVQKLREKDPYRLDIYSRWVNDWPPTHSLPPRHGTDIRYESPYIEPAIHQIQNMYIDLVHGDLVSVNGYYPHGNQNPLGGLKFNFFDGSSKLVGRAENDPSMQAEVKVTLDPEKEERITGWVGYYGRAADGSPRNVYALKLTTNLGRHLALGNEDAVDIWYSYGLEVNDTNRLFGFQIGDSPPWIESFSAVFGPKDKSPEEL